MMRRKQNDEDGERNLRVITRWVDTVDRTVLFNLRTSSKVSRSDPHGILSYDLETSIANNSILCAAVWVEDMIDGSQ